MINIQIYEQFQDVVDLPRVENVVNTVLNENKNVDEIALSVVIADDQKVQTLNREFLGNDSPTDVLSFPANEWDPELEKRYLGDVIISYDQAKRQALAAGHPINAEIELLIVHGIDDKKEMWEIQKKILQNLKTDLYKFPD
jgi:probable rRNA maturation factor